MSKRTYTPSLEELSRHYGPRHFTVETTRDGINELSALIYASLEDIVNTMDATIYATDPDADPAEYSATISYGARLLISMPDCTGPDSAQVLPQPAGNAYEIRQVDAWTEYDDPDDPEEMPGWIYNETWHLGTFTTTGDVPRAFRRALARMGVTFYRGRTVTEYDGGIYEIVDRKTHEPLFAAIPTETA